MKLGFHTRIEVGRLFSSLEYGERIACECAGEQARIAGDERGRFFVRQAYQESHHAEVFRQVVRCVTPFRPRPVPGSLQRYHWQLRRAWCRGDAVDLLVGQQLVLETLGEVILTRMDRKFDQRGIGFRRLRKILLAQEQGHHAFGEHMLKGMIDAGGVDLDQVRDRTCEYLFMAEDVLEELGGVFDAVGADPGVYVAALHRQLAPWTGTDMISVIIPVLNEEITLPSTLRALTSAPGPIETIIVDGGSTDRSVDIASSVGCRVIFAPRGRARQMNAGAAEARGDWLMFLHADTHLHPDAFAAVHALGDDPQQLAGGFHHRFDPSNLRLDLISWINNRRCAHTRVFYGDQAPFVRRSAFRQLGGFPEVSMLEDVLFMEALNRITRPRLMPQAAITDARRFNQQGVVRSFGRVFVILSCHKLGWRIPARKFFAEVR